MSDTKRRKVVDLWAPLLSHFKEACEDQNDGEYYHESAPMTCQWLALLYRLENEEWGIDDWQTRFKRMGQSLIEKGQDITMCLEEPMCCNHKQWLVYCIEAGDHHAVEHALRHGCQDDFGLSPGPYDYADLGQIDSYPGPCNALLAAKYYMCGPIQKSLLIDLALGDSTVNVDHLKITPKDMTHPFFLRHDCRAKIANYNRHVASAAAKIRLSILFKALRRGVEVMRHIKQFQKKFKERFYAPYSGAFEEIAKKRFEASSAQRDP